MELEKFITATLVSIANGIHKANKAGLEHGDQFAVPIGSGDGFLPDSTIEFDILVDVSEGSRINVANNASLMVKFANLLNAKLGTDAMEEMNAQTLSTNRVRFSINAFFAHPEAKPSDQE